MVRFGARCKRLIYGSLIKAGNNMQVIEISIPQPCTKDAQRYLCSGYIGRQYVHAVGLTHSHAITRGIEQVTRQVID